MTKHKNTNSNSEVILIPAPWNPTTLFSSTSHISTKKLIELLKHSLTIDKDIPEFSIHNIGIENQNETIVKQNEKAKKHFKILTKKISNEDISPKKEIKEFNIMLNEVNQIIYDQVEKQIKKDKIIGVIGGDSTASYPIINALIDYVPTFSILSINSELNLDKSLPGINFSTHSVMTEILNQHNDIKRLVQIGIQHYTQEELEIINKEKGRIKALFQDDIKKDYFLGKTWDSYCKKIINNLTDTIYISIHANSLLPHYSSTTNSYAEPSFDYSQINYLIKQICKAKKTIIGFDIIGIEDTDYMLDYQTMINLIYLLASHTWKTHQ